MHKFSYYRNDNTWASFNYMCFWDACSASDAQSWCHYSLFRVFPFVLNNGFGKVLVCSVDWEQEAPSRGMLKPFVESEAVATDCWSMCWNWSNDIFCWPVRAESRYTTHCCTNSLKKRWTKVLRTNRGDNLCITEAYGPILEARLEDECASGLHPNTWITVP